MIIFFLWANDCSLCHDQLQEQINKRMQESSPQSFVNLSAEILLRENQLKLQELNLKKREERLLMLESDFNKKVEQLKNEENRLINCVQENKDNQDKRIKHLVNVLSQMKADAAAKLLNVQDENISVQIIAYLPPERMAKIFNLMDKEISARLQKKYMTMQK